MTNPENQFPLADHIVNYKNMKKETKAKNINYFSIAAELGRLGGRATVKNKGKKYMSEIGKRGAKIRWSKKINK